MCEKTENDADYGCLVLCDKVRVAESKHSANHNPAEQLSGYISPDRAHFFCYKKLNFTFLLTFGFSQDLVTIYHLPGSVKMLDFYYVTVDNGSIVINSRFNLMINSPMITKQMNVNVEIEI
ncbi:uncharacterized protein N7483_011755 [Penicillium malachiteum]|uniref:uncharacterized protein n=1 Tax=Penicillium malachiteum TaxID=1324776 RepID=UPI002547C6C2|nr:uncharacterized protein N7483_011755 [Penicillium malachiteum]KAJ5714574.1 hypothetical protein N7483_011755 [Penicillium malachiteum]